MGAMDYQSPSGTDIPLSQQEAEGWRVIRRKAGEIAGGFILALSASALLALVSYETSDPSFNRVGEDEVANLLGYPGAGFADLALQGFGLAGLLVALIPAAWGWRLTREHGLENLGRKSLNGLGAMLLGSIALSALPAPDSWPIMSGLGGSIGYVGLERLTSLLSFLIGQTASVIVGVLAAIASAWLMLRSSGFCLADLADLRKMLTQAMLAMQHLTQLVLSSLSSYGGRFAQLIHKHRHAIADYLPRVLAKEGDSVAIFCPPRHGGVPSSSADQGQSPHLPMSNPHVIKHRSTNDFDIPESLHSCETGSTQADNLSASSLCLEDVNGTQSDSAAHLQPVSKEEDLSPSPSMVSSKEFDRVALAEDFAELLDDLDLDAPIPDDRYPLDSPESPSLTDSFSSPVTENSIKTDISASSQACLPNQLVVRSQTIPSAPTPNHIASCYSLLPVTKSLMPHGSCQPRFSEADPYHLDPSWLIAEETNPYLCDGDQGDREEALARRADELVVALRDFGVNGDIIKIRSGPIVTLFEFEPAPGTKISRVISLSEDIARAMRTLSARIAPIPGSHVIGIELPNLKRQRVLLRPLLEDISFRDGTAHLPIALGRDIGGAPVFSDLATMPHLLVAGTTGSGKSVAINAMILSLLYQLSPDQCRFLMIDPKMLELSVYDGIPHLLAPVVTEPEKAIIALRWAVREMEERYRKMSLLGVRGIESFNSRLAEANARSEPLTRVVQTGYDPETGQPLRECQVLENFTPLSYIVIIIDEMADLMLTAGKEIESLLQRIAQMARAAGIHVIMATQRPSVDVITGTIKANFPTRMSFQVSSKIDSRTVLGEQGAESLLGHGDMLFMTAGGRIARAHAPFVSDGEVEHVVTELRGRPGPSYLPDVLGCERSDSSQSLAFDDPLYEQAIALIQRENKASTSFIQRHLQIGYNRAARIVEAMESSGIISAANHAGKREVLTKMASKMVE